jgi:hypothetical protein
MGGDGLFLFTAWVAIVGCSMFQPAECSFFVFFVSFLYPRPFLHCHLCRSSRVRLSLSACGRTKKRVRKGRSGGPLLGGPVTLYMIIVSRENSVQMSWLWGRARMFRGGLALWWFRPMAVEVVVDIRNCLLMKP